MKLKFWGYRNRKVNCLMGVYSGGEWVRVSFLTWVWLVLTNGITSTGDTPNHKLVS